MTISSIDTKNLFYPKKLGLINLKIMPEAHRRAIAAATQIRIFFHFSCVPKAPPPEIINPAITSAHSAATSISHISNLEIPVITLANAVSEFGILFTEELFGSRVYHHILHKLSICAIVLFSIHCPINGISVLR